MEKKKNAPKEKEPPDEIIIDETDGLTISYETEELKKNLPHLLSEITENTQTYPIEEVQFSQTKQKESLLEKREETLLDDLINPGVFDFLRRCSNEEEAVEILDYLLKRKEISETQYNTLREQLRKENGLADLIEQYGGFKKPGYYMRKYYQKPSAASQSSDPHKKDPNSSLPQK